ncbi:unnamed protein product, partial [Rotaria magnacalcarata]
IVPDPVMPSRVCFGNKLRIANAAVALLSRSGLSPIVAPPVTVARSSSTEPSSISPTFLRRRRFPDGDIGLT